jgi:hypothetical protein
LEDGGARLIEIHHTPLNGGKMAAIFKVAGLCLFSATFAMFAIFAMFGRAVGTIHVAAVTGLIGHQRR